MKTLLALLLATTTAIAAESDYVKATCAGEIETKLFDGTRIDCMTGTHAIEYDYGHKWAEGVGQALYYSKITGKKPGIALIVDKSEDRFVYRAMVACPECDVFIVDK